MQQMTIALSDDEETFIAGLVAAGRFPSAEAFVLDLLRNERDRQARRTKLDEARNGPFDRVDSALLDALRSDDDDAP